VADSFGGKPAGRAGRKLRMSGKYLAGGAEWDAATQAERDECQRGFDRQQADIRAERDAAHEEFVREARGKSR
jgi:hypothetical protein